MDQHFYTVEQVSEMLNLHPKTTRKYIREGKLRANKVGKQFRITGHDLSLFVEGNQIPVPKGSDSITEHQKKSDIINHEQISVSTVVDYPGIDKDRFERISNMLIAVMNTKDAQFSKPTLSIQYIDHHKMRILMWGTIFFTETMLSYLSAFAEHYE
ncbi:MAG: helix-turn-helix domain-containing protein [Clostridiales bacterium]|nr:helix-turn-helix domain-containing protein [Clostridiales bacterium]